jgi:steroid delta-isomerase-like uncharacterized protein
MTGEQNKAFIRDFVENVINRQDLAAAHHYVATDFEEQDPLPQQEQGLEGLKRWLAMYFVAFPDVRWTLEDQVAEHDRVLSRFTWTGTQAGPFLGIPATGKQVAVSGAVLDRIVDGKLQQSRMLMDTLGLLRQLGVIPG